MQQRGTSFFQLIIIFGLIFQVSRPMLTSVFCTSEIGSQSVPRKEPLLSPSSSSSPSSSWHSSSHSQLRSVVRLSLPSSSLTQTKASTNPSLSSRLLPKLPWTDSRLPTFVRPLHYTISMHPNLTTLDVTGRFGRVVGENQVN